MIKLFDNFQMASMILMPFLHIRDDINVPNLSSPMTNDARKVPDNCGAV